MKNVQRGISLIEVLFSLAILCVILASVANYYYAQNKIYLSVGKAATQIQQLASVSYEWQAAQSQVDFQGISLPILQAAGLFSTTDNYSQIDPWGGAITISPDHRNPQYVLITLPQVPREACVNLRDRMVNVAESQSSERDCADGNYHISM